MKYLRVKGSEVINDVGRSIKLKGFNIGGWLNMENFINGYPGYESTFKYSILSVLGEDRATFYFEKLLEYFLSEDDFKFMKSLGINLIRIPINYRHFADNPISRIYKKTGFNHLDWAIEQAKRNEIYVIIDLHAAPGWQNSDWHSDNVYQANLLWYSEDAQLKTANIWKEIAKKYKDEPTVCGYDIVNEPDAPNQQMLINFYKRIISRIRRYDSQHIIIIEANRYGKDPTGLEILDDENLLFEVHYYPAVLHVDTVYPGEAPSFNGSEKLYYDKNFLEKEFLSGIIRAKHLIDKGKAIFVGEFGCRFFNTPNDQYRIKVIKDLIKIFNKYRAPWTIWNYKDLGTGGLVYLSPNSEYRRKFSDLLELKENLGTDGSGARHPFIKKLSSHSIDLLKEELNMYGYSYVENIMNLEGEILPENLTSRLHYSYNNVVGNTFRVLISHYLAYEFAQRFKNMDYDELDKLARGFHFNNCVKRKPLTDLISSFCKISKGPGGE